MPFITVVYEKIFGNINIINTFVSKILLQYYVLYFMLKMFSLYLRMALIFIDF